jgi:predicted DsbA family dithiol-disulfide isomerase
MAMDFPHVQAEVIEANEFPELSQHYGVSGVPKVIINDRLEFTGAIPESAFVEAIRQAVGAESPESEADS